ncbi:MarR family winged helix-turn-helix transcriptional regulator [Nocardia thailandica]|uniref:MarR family winged helix-turn-helix transcriptional regulator n=1 Tax=Nocardia thailandica TaxID=257275 RepID=UPI0005BB1CDC|nr:MarR family transcriptional regulator [Nocardia thailandica]
MADNLSLDEQLCFPLYAASRAMTAVYRPKLEKLGLTYPQYLVMLALWERDEQTVGELCHALALDSGTLSPLLKRLEAGGFVHRRRSTADERRVEVALTGTGQELRAAACRIPEEMARAAGLSAEQATTLRTLLRTLNQSLTDQEK